MRGGWGERVFEAELSVSSADLTLVELEERLGCPSGPAGYSLGERSDVQGRARLRSCWVEELVLDPTQHAGTAGLDLAISELGDDLASRLRQCRRDGCAVVLGIVQRIADDDGTSRGLHLSQESLSWLARAGAALDIDQYVVGLESV